MTFPSGTDYEHLLASLRLQAPWALISPDALTPHVVSTVAANERTISGLDSRVESDSTQELLEAKTTNRVHAIHHSAAESPQWRSVPELIRAFALSRSNGIALSDGVRKYTYLELENRVNVLASTLRTNGVARGDIVALVLPRSIEFIEALLAVWKLGAAFLPLGPDTPVTWRLGAVASAGAKICVSAERDAIPGLLWVNPLLPKKVIATTDYSDNSYPLPTELAYLIYTSGSTGQPKLVMIDHRGLSNLVRMQQESFGSLNSNARVLHFHNPTFDGAVFEVLLGLAHGVRLEIAPLSLSQSVEGLLLEREITHTLLPATIVRTIRPGSYPSLEVLISGGDVCFPDTARQWRPFLRFFNAYGPTEITVCCTLHMATKKDDELDFLPIGREIAGTHLVVLDDIYRIVPDGNVGEICVGGLGVGPGYFGNGSGTALAFIPDPFSPTPGSRLYRTGDFGRRLTDGNIQLLGRHDAQVKIRGFRVDLIEIETAIRRLDGVRDVVVIAKKIHQELSLVAYIVLSTETGAPERDIRAVLLQRLPHYLVPEAVCVLDRLPLNSSGKVDRSKLPSISPPRSEQSRPPSTPEERALAEIAANLLGLEQIGVDDDFVNFGWNSLLAVRYIARIRMQLLKELSISSLMEAPTVAKTAALLINLPSVAQTAAGLVATAQTSIAPSYAQERAWMLHKLDPRSLAYNAQSVMKLNGILHVEGLEASLTDIVRRHDVLRTRLIESDGELRCELCAPWDVRLPLADLSKEAACDLGISFEKAVRGFVDQPFILEAGYLTRWILLKIAEEEHVLVIVEHHTVHDGWSFNVFVNDLLEGYASWSQNGRVFREKPSVQYYDHARWQREWLVSEEASEHRRFWRNALLGANPLLQLPNRMAVTTRKFRGAAPRFDIGRDLAQQLEALSRHEGTTLFVTLLAAFFLLLHRYTGSDDILLGSGTANRRWRSTESLLGMFVNTIVFRGRMTGTQSFKDHLSQTRQMALAAYDHQELPFEAILEQSEAERIKGTGALIQNCFSFHDAPHYRLNSCPLEVVTIDGLSNGSSKFDLNVIAIPRYLTSGHISRVRGGALVIPASQNPVIESREQLDGITFSWEYDSQLFDPTFIEEMMIGFGELLKDIVQNPDKAISELSIVPQSVLAQKTALVRHSLLYESPEIRLHELVEACAKSSPLATAVVCSADAVSYKSLNDKANQIGLRLIENGIGREDIVGVMLPPSSLSVATLLGILKSGAAYLPLDPCCPEERLRFILCESNARAVVTISDIGSSLGVLQEEGNRIELITVDGLTDYEVDLPVVKGSPSDLAYVIYTSGSTGHPKGVPVEHCSIVARLTEVDFYREAQSYLHVAAPSFDFSVAEIFGPLINGKTVHIPAPGWGLLELRDYMWAQEIRHPSLTTALFHQLVIEAPETFDHVSHVMVAGEILSSDAAKSVLRQGVILSNYYGPTEVTVFTSKYTTTSDEDFTTSVPIGYALPNCFFVILDDEFKLLPVGVIGEICIGGPGVARGYLHKPRLTAERFVPDCFSAIPGARLFLSGDLGRTRHDGALEYIGRRDSQIKIRGFLVDPAELQGVLTGLPDVASAYVVSAARCSGESRLVAYVQAASGKKLCERALRAVLRLRLPDYLLPSNIVIVQDWPINESGKIDRSRLPCPTQKERSASEPPQTSEQAYVSEIIRSLLGVDKFGIDEDFFEAGGTSLIAMKLVARLAKVFGKKIEFATIFTHPTIARLVEAIHTAEPLIFQ
jgi:amino acid adenylation domain-containing protein